MIRTGSSRFLSLLWLYFGALQNQTKTQVAYNSDKVTVSERQRKSLKAKTLKIHQMVVGHVYLIGELIEKKAQSC